MNKVLMSIVIGTIFFAETSHGEGKGSRKPAVSPPASAFQYLGFELSGLYVTQGSSQDSTSGELAWVPCYGINSSLSISGNFGITSLLAKDVYGNQSRFTVLDAEALIRYYIVNNWDVEAGGGLQNWINQGGAKGVVSANIGYHPEQAYFALINRIFIGYSNAFQNVNANEFRVGFGFRF